MAIKAHPVSEIAMQTQIEIKARIFTH